MKVAGREKNFVLYGRSDGAEVDIEYPEVNGNEKYLYVTLCDIRANASTLRLHFDFDRATWVIEARPTVEPLEDEAAAGEWVERAVVRVEDAVA